MRLASDHVEVHVGGETITLRPTLHCAFRLERREGSFAKLVSDLEQGSMTAALFVLADRFNRPSAVHCIIDAGLDNVCASLIAFVLNCAGIDPDVQSTANDGSTVTFADHLTNLYRIATGWLGWTPETAFASTPSEIMEAYKGRIDMLKAIFGGEDDKPEQPKRALTADDLRRAFRDMGAQQVDGNA